MALGGYVKAAATKLMGVGKKDRSAAEKCAAFAEKLYSESQDTLSPLYRQWYEQIVWVLGEQYYEYSSRFNKMIIRPERAHIPRATSNLILDLAERAVAMLVKSNVTGHVRPEGTSVADYQKARRAEYVRKRMWEDDEMALKLREASSWCVFTGNAIWLTALDHVNKPRIALPKMVEKPVIDPATGIAVAGPDGAPLTRLMATDEVDKIIALAEVGSEPINPMEIIPDPYAKNPRKMRYWMHHRLEDIDVLADEFGSEAVEKVKPDNDLRTSYLFQTKLADLVTRASQAGQDYGLTSVVRDNRMDNATIVKTLYRLPCERYPKGEVLVKAGTEILHFGPYPFINDEEKAYRNIHWYGWSLIPGCVWRFGLIRNLMDPQKRVNGMLTQAGLARKTMGNPQWLAPNGVGFPKQLDAIPGAVVKWTPKRARGFEPKRQTGVGMPADFWQELEVTVAHMDRISGMNDVLRGENPPGVDAGVSLEFLGERSSSRFAPAIEEMRKEIKTLEEFRLFLASKSAAWANGKRMYVREEGVGRMVELTNLDAPTDPAIEMEATSSILFSEAAKRANTDKALEAGLIDINLPQNRRKLRDEYGVSEYEDKLSDDVTLAEWENEQLLAGEMVETRQFENPTIHMPIHRALTLEPDYMTLPEATRLRIEAHMAMTQDGVRELALLQEQANQPPDIPPELQAPAGPPGAPGGGEGAPGESAEAEATGEGEIPQ